MFVLFPEFGARTRPQDLWPFLISETGLEFLKWTQGKIHPGNRASPVNRAHMKRPYVEPLVVVDFRFISEWIFACVMSREFTRDLVTKFLPAQFPWIWCKCLLTHLIHSKIFNLTKCREVLQLRERLTDSFFQIINSLIESFWGKLDLPWLLTLDFVCLLFYLQYRLVQTDASATGAANIGGLNFSCLFEKAEVNKYECPQRLSFSPGNLFWGSFTNHNVGNYLRHGINITTNQRLSPTFRGNGNTIIVGDSQTSPLPIFP